MDNTKQVEESKDLDYIVNHYHDIADKPAYVCQMIREDKFECAKLLTDMIGNKRINLIGNLKPYLTVCRRLLSDSKDDKLYDIVVNHMNKLANDLIPLVSKEDGESLKESLGKLYDSKQVEDNQILTTTIDFLGGFLNKMEGMVKK